MGTTTTTDTQLQSEFERLTAPLRPELLAHCYRLLGSASDAEDQVQETYLRAWRAFHSFEGRSSVRTWMYRIATNTCLSALGSAARRVLPTGLGQPAGDPVEPVREARGTPWLEPLPDAVLWSAPTPDPQDATVAREGVGLALVVALQDLPPRQRAALVLRDVLRFSAEEAAGVLGCSVAALNSALQRARARVGEGTRREGRRAEDLSPEERRLYDEFCAAFERYDVPAVVALLASDATWEMPPFDRWYAGQDAVAALIGAQCPAKTAGDLRMLPTVANGQPAAGMYLRRDDGYHPFQLVVLDIHEGRIAHVAGFFEPELFTRAGLPTLLPA